MSINSKDELLQASIQTILATYHNDNEDLINLLKLLDFQELKNLMQNYKLSEIDSVLLKDIIAKKIIGYDVNENKEFLHSFSILGHNSIIERMIVDYNMESTFIFTGGNEGFIKIWNIDTGMLIRSLYGHSGEILDISISFSGKFLSSVDVEGHLIIWDLCDFTIKHKIDLESEIIFCEFIKDPSELSLIPNLENIKCANIHRKKDTDVYNLIILKSNGILYNVKFTETVYSIAYTNKALEGESISAICVTDGGRFICCAGNWSYLVLFDTYDLENIIVLEDFNEILENSTLEQKITNITASKKGFQLAVAYGKSLVSYKYSSLGMPGDGNYKLSFSKKLKGYFNRFILDFNMTGSHRQEIIENVNVTNIAFLYDGILIVTCDDNYIRVYGEDKLICIFQGNKGHIYPHPFERIFAVIDKEITIYKIISDDPLKNDFRYRAIQMYKTDIYFLVNDAMFSNNGNFFIYSDDTGNIRIISLLPFSPSVPRSQFFDLDFYSSIAHYLGTIFSFISTNKISNWMVKNKNSSLFKKLNKFVNETIHGIDSEKKMFILKYLTSSPTFELLEKKMYGTTFDNEKNGNGNNWNHYTYKTAKALTNHNHFIEEAAAFHFKRKKIACDVFKNHLCQNISQTLAETNDISTSTESNFTSDRFNETFVENNDCEDYYSTSNTINNSKTPVNSVILNKRRHIIDSSSIESDENTSIVDTSIIAENDSKNCFTRGICGSTSDSTTISTTTTSNSTFDQVVLTSDESESSRYIDFND